MRQLALSLAPQPLPTLGNFVPGRNAELLAMLSALAAGDRSERMVYIWGGRGCGKTHLLLAMRAAFTGLDVAAELFPGGAEVPELPIPEVILVDDVEQLDELGQERLFKVYNAQRERGGVLIAAGAVPSARLPLRDDLKTRLGWGLVYEVHALSDDEKMAAMTEHARARGFDLGREVIEYLFRRRARDLPALLALLEALDRYSMENKRAITIPLVRELLSDTDG